MNIITITSIIMLIIDWFIYNDEVGIANFIKFIIHLIINIINIIIIIFINININININIILITCMKQARSKHDQDRSFYKKVISLRKVHLPHLHTLHLVLTLV